MTVNERHVTAKEISYSRKTVRGYKLTINERHVKDRRNSRCWLRWIVAEGHDVALDVVEALLAEAVLVGEQGGGRVPKRKVQCHSD